MSDRLLHERLLREARLLLQNHPDLRAVLEDEFDAWTPRGQAAARAICEFVESMIALCQFEEVKDE